MNRSFRVIIQFIIFLFKSGLFIVKTIINLIILLTSSQPRLKRQPNLQQTCKPNLKGNNHIITSNHHQRQINWNNGKNKRKSYRNYYYDESDCRQFTNYTYRRNYWPPRSSKTQSYKKSSMQVNCGKSSPSNQWFTDIIREWTGFVTPLIWVALIVLTFVLLIFRHD